jgi:hypothetical protein
VCFVPRAWTRQPIPGALWPSFEAVPRRAKKGNSLGSKPAPSRFNLTLFRLQIEFKLPGEGEFHFDDWFRGLMPLYGQ